MIRFDRSALRRGFGRAFVLDLLETGSAAIDPRRAVSERVLLDGTRLRVGRSVFDLAGRHVWAFAIGKAAVPMAEAVSDRLGAALAGGIAVTRYGHGGPAGRFRVFEAGHPVPDASSVRAGEAVAELADAVGEGDVALCLLSGGGSALLAAPPNGVTLDDLVATTRLLLESGAAIEEINTVRRQLSTVHGGRLGRRLHRARVATLALSDVIGDRPEAIASGPTVPDPTTGADAIDLLRRLRLWHRLPSSVRRHLEREAHPSEQVPADPTSWEVTFEIVGSNGALLDAIEHAGRDAGCTVIRAAEPTSGEARCAGGALGRRAVGLAEQQARRTLWIAGGETTVTVRGGGSGGRNLEFALAASLEMASVDGVCVAALATDGSDGPTDAAGGIVDGSTAGRVERAGLDPRSALEDNDSLAALGAAGDVLRTGPTRTNVADVYVAFIDAA